MGKRSRTKGAAFERRVANMFTEHGFPAKRNLEEVRSGNSGDIQFNDPYPMTVQVKCGARPNPYAAMREALEASKPGDFSVAILHMDGGGGAPALEMACLPLDQFLDLIKFWEYGGG